MLPTSGWTPRNWLFRSKFLLVAVVNQVRSWSGPECSRGTKQLLVDMLWRLLLLCATDDCRLIQVLTGCSHIYCRSRWKVPDVTLASCHLLRCVPESVAAFVIWRTELCAHLLPTVADLSRHPISLSFMGRTCRAHLTKQPQCFPVCSSRATES